MRLTDLFIQNRQTTQAGDARPVSDAQIALINRQIRALVPGQTILGEVLSRNGNEVQVRLAEDFIINAKIDRAMGLELGKNLYFEVRNNGSALTLSPLFSNMATDTNVFKALDMSGLPINKTTVSMTEEMMNTGLSVDKNSLQQVFREVNLFPRAELSDIVDLHKLKLPVTEENLTQIASYKNLTHQLSEGMNQVTVSLAYTIQNMVAEGSIKEAAGIYLDLLSLMTADAVDNTGNMPDMPQTDTVSADTAAVQSRGSIPQENVQQRATDNLQQQVNTVVQQSTLQDGMIWGMEEVQSLQQSMQQTVQLVSGAEDQQVQSDMPQETQQASVKELIRAFVHGDEVQLKSILGDKEIQKFMMDYLKEQWLIAPKEVADEGRVEELYNRLSRQLKEIANVLENAGQAESTAFRATTNLSNNIDFLHQFNQMYTYVQLPLKLQQGQAHGDLYVYTNKKNLAEKNGQISALLHLDMEHLGPVDVYVAMNAGKVNTKFYVQDDSMLDFLEEHMELLTERLHKRGYDCSFDMQVRNSEEDIKSGIKPLMETRENVQLVQYAFDMRA